MTPQELKKERHREASRKWRKEHPEESSRRTMEYDKLHKDKKLQRDRKYANTTRKVKRRNRRVADFKYRLDSNVSCLMSISLKHFKAGRKWESLVGYNLEDLVAHLEKQFDNKMNWENYGSYWWVDHIKPRSLFCYDKPEDIEFRKCWALENLQPLEKIMNIKKGNKIKVG